MQEDIIIIGAGPAGLMAAYELSKAGQSAVILEARDRIGGRTHTLYDAFGGSVETGAEFIHGKLPLTLELLKKARITHTATAGKWLVVKGGELREDSGGKDWALFMKKLGSLKTDMTLQAFLEQYFSEAKYASLKDRAVAYAEGYDAADASRVSALALYAEWSKAEEEEYRIDEGYSGLMDFLAEESRKAGTRILLSKPVTRIVLDKDMVTVHAGTDVFTAARVIVAVPLGVLQAGALPISPDTAAYRQAIEACGFGDVIKFSFRFREAFWEDEYPELGFLMSGATVPTWWTQAPEESPLLTGWMAGRIARAHKDMSKRQLMLIALDSLAGIFSRDADDLGSLLAEVHVSNWSADPYTRGAYAYPTLGSAEAIEALSQPLGGKVYFAGEYVYAGPAMGTVEAALSSGQRVASQLSSLH